MKKDTIEQLFKTMKGQFDIAEPDLGHQQRFLDKLNAERTTVDNATKKSAHNWRLSLAIAASIMVLFSLGFFQWNAPNSIDEQVAAISPEASKTEFHFANLIEQRVKELELETSPETEKIIADTMVQLKKLETDYSKMEQDLLNGGNSKLILSAMITNFQTRIDLLNAVMIQIDTIKHLKNTNDANYTI